MAEKRIDQLDDAAAVTGSHEVPVSQSGVAKRATVNELAAGIAVATPLAVKKAGVLVGTRRGLNLIEGSNVTLTVADDAGNDEVDVTIASTGGSGGSAAAIAWTTYTPTWLAGGAATTLGNGTLVGSYLQIGYGLAFRLRLQWGSTTSSPAGDWSFSLPAGFTATAAQQQPVVAHALDSGTRRYSGAGVLGGGGTTVALVNFDAAQASATTPFTWAANDYLLIEGLVEVTTGAALAVVPSFLSSAKWGTD